MDFMGWPFVVTLLWQGYETYKFVIWASTALAAALHDENTLSERNLAEHAFSEHASSGRNSSEHNCAEEHAPALNPDPVNRGESNINGPERLVGLEFMGHDPQSWRRIYWRGRRLRAYLVADTGYRANISDQGTWNLQPPVAIVLPRVFGVPPLTKLQLSAALVHKMVHAFIAWHWNGCPLLGAIEGFYENGHGVVFWRILASINMTVASWHQEFQEFGAAADIAPPSTWKTSAVRELRRLLSIWDVICSPVMDVLGL
ncbi:hypothetical protein DL770_009952 [Monosporascus sp. CRB-9-2]|nr:hypothetical protein DL770_009952 [Monosporascus sp. CRB-9-2]